MEAKELDLLLYRNRLNGTGNKPDIENNSEKKYKMSKTAELSFIKDDRLDQKLAKNVLNNYGFNVELAMNC